MPETTERRRLPKVVWKLGWISFFADVASEMVYPLIPLFLTGPLGAPKWILGLVEGSAESVVSFMKAWSGIGSDRRQARKPYIVAGYGLSALGKPLLGLAVYWPLALLSRSIDRIGKGLRTTARDALIADAVEPAQRGAAFGLHRGLDTAGALVGVAIVALLIHFLGSNLQAPQFRTIFLLAAIPGAVSIVIALSIRDVRSAARNELRRVPWKALIQELPREFWWAAGLFALFSFANSSDTFILLRAKDLGYSTLQVILAYGLYNIAYMVVSYPAGKLSDRLGRWPVITLGWLLYSAVYLGFAFASRFALPGLLLTYGVYMGLTKAVGTALVADYSPAEWKGMAMGLFFFISGIATVAGNILGGALWDVQGAQATFLAGSILALLAVIGAALMGRHASQKRLQSKRE